MHEENRSHVFIEAAHTYAYSTLYMFNRIGQYDELLLNVVKWSESMGKKHYFWVYRFEYKTVYAIKSIKKG